MATVEQLSKRYALSYPVAEGEVVTQGHADYCAAHGHAHWVVDGTDRGICPRCGEVTEAAK